MRVAVDARDLNRVHLRGMGRYVWEIVRHGSANPDIHWILLTDRPEWPVHVPAGDRICVEVFAWRGHRLHLWEQIGLPLRAATSDVLVCPSMRAPYLHRAPTVVTIHDTIPWDRDEPDWGRNFYTDRLMPAAFRRCASVITGSQASADDIVRHWPDMASNVHVIHNGVADEYLAARPGPLTPAIAALGVREPYLLYFGGETPRKRLDWAMEVFRQVADARVGLVVCGVSAAARETYRARLPEDIRRRVWFLPFVAETDLPRLYQNAVALLYPTQYEGFGLPPLEAQAVGTPAVFSPVSSLPEVAGPAAVLVPPTDMAAWRGVVTRLIDQRATACGPHEESRLWARQFSWARTATRTVEIYASVARRARRHHAGRNAT